MRTAVMPSPAGQDSAVVLHVDTAWTLRANERRFSFRSAQRRWHPRVQRPGLWRLHDTRIHSSERQGRLIDHHPSASMQKKKQEGHF